MAMAGAVFRDLPGELEVDLAATTVLGLEGDTPVLMVAGPDASGKMTVSSVTEAWIETLWSQETAPRGLATGGRADLVATQDGRALALIPGQALVLLDPLADSEAQRSQRLKPGRARLPDRLFATGGGIIGIWVRSNGKTLLATLDAKGAREPGSERAGPSLKPGQTVNLVLRDAAGRDVVVAEDHRVGFQIWRQECPDNWAHLAQDGAARHGLNACVIDGLLWGERVVLATGSPPAVSQALLGMLIRSELIMLDPDGQLHLLAGEVRSSPMGLMVPKLSASAIMMFGLGHFSHLAIDDTGRLILATRRPNGHAALFAIAADMTVTALADPCDTIVGFVPDDSVSGRVGAVISQSPGVTALSRIEGDR